MHNQKNTVAHWNWHRLSNWPPRAKSFPYRDIWGLYAEIQREGTAKEKMIGSPYSFATSDGCLEIHVRRLSSLFIFNDTNNPQMASLKFWCGRHMKSVVIVVEVYPHATHCFVQQLRLIIVAGRTFFSAPLWHNRSWRRFDSSEKLPHTRIVGTVNKDSLRAKSSTCT